MNEQKNKKNSKQKNDKPYKKTNTKNNSKKKLTEKQVKMIESALSHKMDFVFFEDESLPDKIFATTGLDNRALIGDTVHFVLHGITLGGMFHKVQRRSNWEHHKQNVYERLCFNNSLKIYMPMDQMIVMGKNYVTLHQFGETSQKEIGYENIVKIELKNMFLKVTVFAGTKLNGSMDYRFYHFNLYSGPTETNVEMIKNLLEFRMNFPAARGCKKIGFNN